jgi:hypothetical protein
MISFPFEVGVLCWASTIVFWVAVVLVVGGWCYWWGINKFNLIEYV